MNFKRKKCKRQVRCTLCTPNRWRGNSKQRRPDRENGLKRQQLSEINEVTSEAN